MNRGSNTDGKSERKEPGNPSNGAARTGKVIDLKKQRRPEDGDRGCWRHARREESLNGN